jgi:glycosyltransferase involved in cell wall biosynthesis
MMRINYISNISVTQDRGGWDAMNKNVYEQLTKFSEINLVDGVNPPFSLYQRILSKIQRSLGIPALFPGFSLKRLRRIATLVECKLSSDAELNFFHGSTPWIMVKNKLPYACYLDASFNTYLAIYHKGDKFKNKKTFELETKFLRHAKAVFFSSAYSLNQTKNAYSLPGENFYNASLGGNLAVNENLRQGVRNRFVFVGHDYHGKGGDLAVEAFRIFSQKTSGLTMTLVGAAPPADALNISGVEYAGYLDKHKDGELKKFLDILESALALVLPTSKDLTPLVIIEAGYCGCPTIATNAFGIPEMIGEHGYLCDAPIQVQELVQAMSVINNRQRNSQSIRDFYTSNFSWDASGNIIKSVLGS